MVQFTGGGEFLLFTFLFSYLHMSSPLSSCFLLLPDVFMAEAAAWLAFVMMTTMIRQRPTFRPLNQVGSGKGWSDTGGSCEGCVCVCVGGRGQIDFSSGCCAVNNENLSVTGYTGGDAILGITCDISDLKLVARKEREPIFRYCHGYVGDHCDIAPAARESLGGMCADLVVFYHLRRPCRMLPPPTPPRICSSTACPVRPGEEVCSSELQEASLGRFGSHLAGAAVYHGPVETFHGVVVVADADSYAWWVLVEVSGSERTV